MEQLNHIRSFYAHSSKRFKFQIYWQTIDTPFLTSRKARALCLVRPMMKVVLCMVRGLNEGATFKLWNNLKPSIFPLFVPQKSILHIMPPYAESEAERQGITLRPGRALVARNTILGRSLPAVYFWRYLWPLLLKFYKNEVVSLFWGLNKF